MDLHDALDDLASVIESARSMPMSASCIINRGEALDLVRRIREMLPQELHHADLLLREREVVIEEGRREAERILAGAREERARMLAQAGSDPFARPDYGPPQPDYGPPSDHGVPDQRTREYPGGGAYRDEIVEADAMHEADTLRHEADEYVDQQLANLEVILNKALASVQRGRDRLHGADDDFGPPADLR